MERVRALRAGLNPTVPSTMGEEKQTNPFLRAHSLELRRSLGLEQADAVEVFGEARRRKDVFKG